jgi:hypothetical protein
MMAANRAQMANALAAALSANGSQLATPQRLAAIKALCADRQGNP